MTPEHHDAAASIWSARAVWPLLAGSHQSGTTTPRPTTAPGRIPVAEPGGGIPGIPRPAPANLAAVDASSRLLAVVTTTAYAMASTIRQHPGQGMRLTRVSADDPTGRFAHITTWMLVRLPDAPRLVAADLAQAVGSADAMARRILRVDRDRVPLRARCPACRERWLRVDTAAPDRTAWTVRCARPVPPCRCTGPGCPCGIDNAITRSPHVWPATIWKGEVLAACPPPTPGR